MSLVQHCSWCDTVDGPLTEAATVEANSGPGWFYWACRPCLVRKRLIPLAAHPDTSRGEAHRYPRSVPDALVARLAEVPDPSGLRPAVNALFAAERNQFAGRQVQDAIAQLRTLARSGLRPVPDMDER